MLSTNFLCIFPDLARDLKSRQWFVRPFLLACLSRNPKFVGSGIAGLQRLVVSDALPRDALADVLDAFQECSTLALDIQLKVLQALPSLLQNYAGSLTGDLLLAAFQVCFLLYNSRTAVVSNTAAAALQQLVSSTLEKVLEGSEDLSTDGPILELTIGDDIISVHGAALDAYRMLDDICLLTDGQRPKHLAPASLAQNFGLELLESILTNHTDALSVHLEQVHVLRIRLMPLVIKVLSEKVSFSTTVRIMRLLGLIVGRFLSELAPECEMALSLLNHMLDPDAAPTWKRILCLEVFRGFHLEPALIRRLYAMYDEADEKNNIIRDHLGNLVRVASEKPAIIGLGQQSSKTQSLDETDESGEQAVVQAGGVVGSIGTPVASVNSEKYGISNLWSTVRVPCIEILDKSEAPALPVTYIYSLALACVTSYSEGLARFLLPFTVPPDNRSKRKQQTTQDIPVDDGAGVQTGRGLSRTQSYGGRKKPVNPLSMSNHVLYGQISTSAQMVDHCWPALLAASSTYLNATLDSENYHALIRSVQKFTQIAGLLELAIPRDAFLTTLGKHAVPSINTNSLAIGDQKRGSLDEPTDSDRVSSPRPGINRQISDLKPPKVNTRHLLCLRALLNLGIALGPVLNTSWTIIFETLLQAELCLSYMNQSRKKPSRGSISVTENDPADPEDLGLEITAAETAASRLFEATSDLSTDAFLEFLGSLCSLLQLSSPTELPENGSASTQPSMHKDRKARSVSSFAIDGRSRDQSNCIIIAKIDELIQNNTVRLLHPSTSESGWDLLLEILNSITTTDQARTDIRIKASNTLHDLLIAVAVVEEPLTSEEWHVVRNRCLDALLHEIHGLHKSSSKQTKASEDCEVEVHRLALESLKQILEHCGESLVIGWDTVLEIIDSVSDGSGKAVDDKATVRVLSPKLIRSAFNSLQLVCSDFLNSVPTSQLLALLDTLYFFCTQDKDFNISLTTATFFRNVSDYLLASTEPITFELLPYRRTVQFDVADWIRRSSTQTPVQGLWLYLLLRLESLSCDTRLEVRHSALHTLFRIFEACFEQLTGFAAELCFDLVLVRALLDNEDRYSESQNSDRRNLENPTGRDWNRTAVVEVGGISEIYSQWLCASKESLAVEDTFVKLLERFNILLGRRILSLSEATFAGFNKVLAAMRAARLTGSVQSETFTKVWEIWDKCNPALHEDDSEKKQGDNQNALIAYLRCLQDLLRLTAQKFSVQNAKMVMKQVRLCVVDSAATVYTSDIDRMTPVQEMVLESLQLFPSVNPGIAPVLAQSINGFVTLAYEQEHEDSDRKQTYIALSKAAMSLLESFFIEHVGNRQLNMIAIAVEAGDALTVPISKKYTWKLEGKGSPPWQKATTTALAILETAVPIVQKYEQDLTLFWEVLVKTNDFIISADCAACTDSRAIPSDCDFDVEGFSRARKILVPGLGAASISDSIRGNFVESIFKNSLIHEPHIDDLARPGQGLLEGLRSIHIGRVQDLPPSPRSKMSYLLLDELFDLVAVHDGSLERVTLAQAAAPYLILRTGLTLKAYIMDHPLRGRMPQPRSQKQEMFYILRKLIELDSEPQAISAAPGITSEYKKHLHRIYQMLMRALKAAWRDEAMTKAIQAVLDAVGDDFGI